MAKDGKNFNIPRGVDEESEAIRNALRQRIMDYEARMPKQNVVPQNQAPQNQAPQDSGQFQPAQASNPQPNAPQQAQSNPNWYDQTNHQSSSYANPGQQQNMSFQQYQQNLNQGQPNINQYQNKLNQNQQNQPTPQQNLYSNQQYSSPFAQPASANSSFAGQANNNYATAGHSAEPVIYKPRKRKSAAKTFLFLFVLIAIIFGLSWALREFVFQAYEIPSGSMEKTIMTGDMVFAEKLSYKFGTPQPGDIITFEDPLNPNRILIKRVIATAGQTIDIKENKLYINGVEQHEDYVNFLPTTQLRSATVVYPYTVPDDQVWVMGDNRTNSQDSRYFGGIPLDSVIGQALVVYWPVSNAKNLK